MAGLVVAQFIARWAPGVGATHLVSESFAIFEREICNRGGNESPHYEHNFFCYRTFKPKGDQK
jgi:hypothetical protein